MTRGEITKLIQRAVRRPSENIQVEHPEVNTHGDYSTNIALQLKRNPLAITRKLKSNLFEKIEVAKPGFINFFLSKEYLQKQVGEILKRKEGFGRLKIGRNRKAQVEFISANPTGPLHLGNGRGAFFGDSLANVLAMAGFKVTREYYVNDAKNSAQIQQLGKTVLGKGTTYLAEKLKTQISKLKTTTQTSKLTEGEAGYQLAQIVQKDTKNFIIKKLKIKFNNWVSEQNFYQENKTDEIYDWLKKKNLIYKKEDAEWLKTSEFSDTQDRVLIRTNGQPTYLLSDIVYHKSKFDRRFAKIINILGADHQGHVRKLKAVSKMLNYKRDLVILISQIVRLKKGKISKRRGEIVTLEWLIDEVGLDAARFFYLMRSLDTQMEFDVELAKEKSQKSPVYYVQYAHARIHSILAKSKITGPEGCNQKSKIDYKLLTHHSELNLVKQLIKFPEIVEDTARDYQVQRLPQYAIDLATVFHQFYRDCKVIDEGKTNKARLDLIKATKIVLKNTLDLMGISAPEKM